MAAITAEYGSFVEGTLVTTKPAASSASHAASIRSRRERDWRNGTLLIVAITALPILVVALLRAFQG